MPALANAVYDAVGVRIDEVPITPDKIVKALDAARAGGRQEEVGDIANLLLDQAYILDGEVPVDRAAFARRLNAFIVRGLQT
jgi:HSP90 family molecular chaperone